MLRSLAMSHHDAFASLMGIVNETIDESIDEAIDAPSREIASPPSWRDRLGMLMSPSSPSSPSPGAVRGASRRRLDDHNTADGFDDTNWSDDGNHEEEENVEDDDGERLLQRQRWLQVMNDAWSWLDAEDEFDGIVDQDTMSDDGSMPSLVSVDSEDLFDDDDDLEDFDDGDVVWEDHFDDYGTWQDDDDYEAPSSESNRSSILNDASRRSVDRETTASWTLRQKNSMTESRKSRFAKTYDSCKAATKFRCPCGLQPGGAFCCQRIELTVDTVRQERSRTFAAPVLGKGRIRYHAIRLLPHIHDPGAHIATGRFFPAQRPSRYHFFVGGQAVCQDTYMEVCALSNNVMAGIRKMANAAFRDDVDLINAAACDLRDAHVSERRKAETDRRTAEVIAFLDQLAEDCCEAIPDGETIESLAARDSADESINDGCDGGTEWRLPFRDYRVIWRMYACAGSVLNPYTYSRFILKWWENRRNIKRAGKAKDGFCQCDTCLRIKRRRMLTTITQVWYRFAISASKPLTLSAMPVPRSLSVIRLLLRAQHTTSSRWRIAPNMPTTLPRQRKRRWRRALEMMLAWRSTHAPPRLRSWRERTPRYCRKRSRASRKLYHWFWTVLRVKHTRCRLLVLDRRSGTRPRRNWKAKLWGFLSTEFGGPCFFFQVQSRTAQA